MSNEKLKPHPLRFFSILTFLMLIPLSVSSFWPESLCPLPMEQIISFRHLQLILGLIAGGYFFNIGCKFFCLGTLVLCSMIGFDIYSWQLPSTSLPRPGVRNQATLKIMQANLLYGNEQFSRALRVFREEKPDLLYLTEMHGDWGEKLKELSDILPYRLPNDLANRVPVELLSHYPIEVQSAQDFHDSLRPTLTLHLDIAGNPCTVMTATLPAPISLEKMAQRNAQLNSISQAIRSIEGQKLLLADLNTTMWSPYYREFMKSSGLRSGRQGFGSLPTWFLIWNGFPLLGAPIDHALFSPEIAVQNARLGHDIGSDHLPLITEVVLLK